MMTVNNFYSPKIYDVTRIDIQSLNIYFTDSTGEKIPIRTSYSGTGFLDEIYQASFRIECELVIIKEYEQK
jgi:hypothetical protein